MLYVSCCLQQLPTSLGVPYQWTEGRGFTAPPGSYRVYTAHTPTHTHTLSLSHTHTLSPSPSLSPSLSLSDHEGFPAQLHSDVELPPKGEVTEPAPSEDLYRALLELYKSKL